MPHQDPDSSQNDSKYVFIDNEVMLPVEMSTVLCCRRFTF